MESDSLVSRIGARLATLGHSVQPARTIIYNNFSPLATSVLMFFFSAGSQAPIAVVKGSRDLERLSQEHDNLREVAQVLGDRSPEPLFFEGLREIAVLCTAHVSGSRISGFAERLRFLNPITAQLIDFQRAVRRPGNEQSLDNVLAAPIDALVSMESDEELQSCYRAIGSKMRERHLDVRIPVIPQHGDFYFDNILVDGDKIRFMDWEDFREISVPGYDLFCLLLDLRLAPNAAGASTGDRHSSPEQEAVRAYCGAFELPAEAAEALLVHTLVKQYLRSCELMHSSQEKLKARLRAYAQSPEAFSQSLGLSF